MLFWHYYGERKIVKNSMPVKMPVTQYPVTVSKHRVKKANHVTTDGPYD